MKDVCQATLKNIKDKEIKPISRHYFVIKWSTIWLAAALFAVVSSLIFSLIIFGLQESDWDVYFSRDGSFWYHLLEIAPWLWLCSGLILIIFLTITIKHTQQGHLYRRRWLILGGLSISFLLGFFLQLSGLSYKIDHYVDKTIPSYSSLEDQRIRIWTQPEYGLLTGEITKTTADGSIILKDVNGRIWAIRPAASSILPAIDGNLCRRIKIIGVKKDELTFISTEIRPWSKNIAGCN